MSLALGKPGAKLISKVASKKLPALNEAKYDEAKKWLRSIDEQADTL